MVDLGEEKAKKLCSMVDSIKIGEKRPSQPKGILTLSTRSVLTVWKECTDFN